MKKYGICFLICIVCMAGAFWLYPGKSPEPVLSGEAALPREADLPEAAVLGNAAGFSDGGFFLVLGEADELLIYHADRATLYKRLSHEHITLGEEQAKLLTAGIRFSDTEQLYRFLESITS